MASVLPDNCTTLISFQYKLIASSMSWASPVGVLISLLGFGGNIGTLSTMWFLNRTMRHFFEKVQPAPVSAVDKKILVHFFVLGCTDTILLLRVHLLTLLLPSYGLKVFGDIFTPLLFLCFPFEAALSRVIGPPIGKPICSIVVLLFFVLIALMVSGLLVGTAELCAESHLAEIVSLCIFAAGLVICSLFWLKRITCSDDESDRFRRSKSPLVRVRGGRNECFLRPYFMLTALLYFILQSSHWTLNIFPICNAFDESQAWVFHLIASLVELVSVGMKWPIYFLVNRRVLKANQEARMRRKCSNPNMSNFSPSSAHPSTQSVAEYFGGSNTRRAVPGRKTSRLSASPVLINNIVEVSFHGGDDDATGL